MIRWLPYLFLLPATWGAGLVVGMGVVELSPMSVEAEAQSLPLCGTQLVIDASIDRVVRAQSTRVVLAIDEEWQARFWEDSRSAATSLLWQASTLFRALNIHLLPVRMETWQSPDVADSAALLSAARSAIPLGGADIVVVLTGQELAPADGRAEFGGRYALVGHHPERPERDAAVLAHEVAHLFGGSHGCDLPGHSGFMAKKGFKEPDLVCPCTRQVLEMNAARFHQQ